MLGTLTFTRKISLFPKIGQVHTFFLPFSVSRDHQGYIHLQFISLVVYTCSTCLISKKTSKSIFFCHYFIAKQGLSIYSYIDKQLSKGCSSNSKDIGKAYHFTKFRKRFRKCIVYYNLSQKQLGKQYHKYQEQTYQCYMYIRYTFFVK